MMTLRTHLAYLPHRDLRAIATRLGLRQHGQHRKEAWIAAIEHFWHDATQRTAWLARLSPSAHAAIRRLLQAGELPTALFLAEYGPIRRARPGRHWALPPWEAPQNVSEELYYCGLLCPTTDTDIMKSSRLAVPADLQLDLLPPDDRRALVQVGPLPLLHDLAQVLIYLAQHPDLALWHQTWLPTPHLAPLNRRLLCPEAEPLPRSHKRTPWLRFLLFLARAADLLPGHGIRLTPAAMAWLAQPPAQQLASLWQAWIAAAPDLRLRYDQPAAHLPPPWPQLLLDQLAPQTAPFTAAQLANGLLGQERRFQAYLVAHLPDLNTLDALIEDMLAGPLRDLAAVATVPPVEDPAGPASPTAGTTYTVTTAGAWLLGQPDSAPPFLFWTTAAGLLVESAPERPDASAHPQIPNPNPAIQNLQLMLPVTTAPRLQLLLAPYAEYRGRQDHGDQPGHLYSLNAASVAQAVAAGHGLPPLLDAFRELGISLTQAHIAQLYDWHSQGRALQLLTLPVLRTATADYMARIHQAPGLGPYLGELLSPTTCVLAQPPSLVADRLRGAGFYPDLTRLPAAVPSPDPQATDRPAAEVPERGAPQVTDRTSPIANPESEAALWLAGQLYALLGQHLCLPLSPPFAELQTRLAHCAPLQQAILQAQWEQLRNDVLDLLDGRAFAPPPHPSDPNRWRPLIAQAIADGRSLEMTYFTAGRNLLTRRVVTPYWLEEHRGIPYLRADCHQAGKVLLFRLDRIQSLGERGA